MVIQEKVNHEIIIKEAIKTRQKSKKDPDYWETDRPNPNIGMKEDNNLDTKTRNHPVTKNVVYFDFRSELSSFDKYFHFYKSKNDKKIRDKEKKLKETKNYIRKKSSLLKDAFNGKFVSFPRYPNNILNEECIIIDKTQDRECLDMINYILGKNYVEIKLVYHRIYESWGISTMVKTVNDIEYSEANAGSGENAVIRMVLAVLKAKKNSLILLDEPEVSLHPGAQKRLKIFLLNLIRKRYFQMIISTHSTILIEELPSNSIKLLETDANGKINITNEVYYKEAFFNINEQVTEKALILCEDISAKMLIEAVLKKMKKECFFNVQYRHGGAETLITKHFPILALDQIYKDVFIILDGDKMPENLIKYSIDVKAQDINNVEILERYVNNNIAKIERNGKINPYVDGGRDGSREDQKLEVYKKYLIYAENHLLFLPRDMTPEMIMLSDSKVKQDNMISDENIFTMDKGKNTISNIAFNILGDNEASSIEATYKILIKRHYENNDPNEYYNELENTLQSVYNFHNNPVEEKSYLY